MGNQHLQTLNTVRYFKASDLWCCIPRYLSGMLPGVPQYFNSAVGEANASKNIYS